MKRFVCAAALAAAAAFAEEKPAAAPAKMEMPKPPAEMAAAKWFVGAWNCKRTQGVNRMEFKMVLGGSWLYLKSTMIAGPMKGRVLAEAFTGWDGAQYHRYGFLEGGMGNFTSKGWDGDKIVYDGERMMGGQKIALHQTITRKGDNQYENVTEHEGKVTDQETCTRAGPKG